MPAMYLFLLHPPLPFPPLLSGLDLFKAFIPHPYEGSDNSPQCEVLDFPPKDVATMARPSLPPVCGAPHPPSRFWSLVPWPFPPVVRRYHLLFQRGDWRPCH